MTASIALLRELVGFDTTSHRSNLPLVDWAAALLAPLGARIRLSHDGTRTKANLLASFGPPVAGGIVLSGHTDVVPVDGQPWSSDPFVLTERDGRLHGRGATDMKGFLACCLAAGPAIAAAELKRPIHLALSYDEEVGCFGVPGLIADLLAHEQRPALAIIGEPTQMRIGDRHRGFLGFRTRFTGRPAHSGDPGAGASALYPACAFVSFLKAIGEGGGSGIDRTTFNVGRIDGGSAINIVPGRCEVVWEFRPAPGADIAALRMTIETFLARATPDEIAHATELLTYVPPLDSEPGGAALALTEGFGALAPAFAMPFGTEAGFFREAGIPAVICGPGAIAQAHQPDEWIAIDQLLAADRFLARIVQWAGRDRD
jgi:acetylornithine deacetylase